MPYQPRRPHTNSQLAEDEIAALRAEARERRVSMSRIVDESVGAFFADEGFLAGGLVKRSFHGRPTRQVGFVLSPHVRELLRIAKRTHRFAHTDVIREAISPIVRRRGGG
jgi:hypothetical protein